MTEQKQHTSWLSALQTPLLIAGPCSAESEEQMLATAAELKQYVPETAVFRAGIWKPRTKPNGFEGVGAVGLQWLSKVKEQYGFLTATEVANDQHVEAALKADVDILWIGARSTANPFTVQEIAEALAGTDKIVLVKNPVNPDLALWIGALERLQNKGIHRIGAIHRGFSTYQKTTYRNLPNWQIPLDLKAEYPTLPLLVDPSHICGNRTGLQSIAQNGLNMGFDGLMIETHHNPDKAWSDAAQQITPEQLHLLIKKLTTRSADTSLFAEDLEKYRMLINETDAQLVQILAQRLNYVSKIGVLKKNNQATVFQPDRWQQVKEQAAKQADQNKICQDFVKDIFKMIHEQSVMVQNQIINGEER